MTGTARISAPFSFVDSGGEESDSGRLCDARLIFPSKCGDANRPSLRAASSLPLRHISSLRFRPALNRSFPVKTRVDWCRSLHKSVPIVQLFDVSRTPILEGLSCVSLR
jgi:hypothetical protein